MSKNSNARQKGGRKSADLPNDFNLEWIRWLDAHGVTTEWTDVADLQKSDVPVLDSVGWVIKEEPEFIVVLPHKSHKYPDGEFGCGEMLIPVEAVRSRVTLVAKK